MKTANLIFPHQLFEFSPLLDKDGAVFLVEEYLFFKQYKFHKQKIAFHRSSMKRYEAWLKEQNIEVTYVDATEERSDIRLLIADLKSQGYERIRYIDPTDNWLEKRNSESCASAKLETQILDSPLFLNSKIELESFFEPDKSNFNQTSFYIQQRKQRDVLIDANQKPLGGSWTYDKDNRKKYPAKKQPPPVHWPDPDPYYEESVSYVEDHFSDHLGELSPHPLYPTDFESSRQWLNQFLEYRFAEFGPYEDAIVAENSILNHSVLSPLMNVGLLTPEEVIRATIEFADQNSIPLNSTEGFVRQVMGWREFLRGIYEFRGSYQRTFNYWKFKRKIPSSFYDGTTGIPPIDQTIQKVLKTGYCHHIERLMVLGNFMLLCEIHPTEVYNWFMEMYVDGQFRR